MRRALVFGLRARNVDVLTAAEAGMINRSDEDHLKIASSHGRAIYTFNVADFCVLHQAWLAASHHHAGIIVAPQQRYSVGEELRRLMKLVGTVSAIGMRDRIEFLANWG